MPEHCPSHPSQPYEDCPVCEAGIRRAELAESDPGPDDRRADAAYEKWLYDQWTGGA